MTTHRPHPRFQSLRLAALALVGSAALSGCAAFNKGQLVLARNVSIGQELIDLHEAHERGLLTDTEYLVLKSKIIALADQPEVIHVADFDIPVETSEHE